VVSAPAFSFRVRFAAAVRQAFLIRFWFGATGPVAGAVGMWESCRCCGISKGEGKAGGILSLDFPAFHPPVISTVLCSLSFHVSADRRKRRLHFALSQQFGFFLSHLPRAFGIAHLFRDPVQLRKACFRLEILSGFRQRLQLFVRCLVIGRLVVPRPFSARVEVGRREPAPPMVFRLRPP